MRYFNFIVLLILSVCVISCDSEKAREKKAEDLISKKLFEEFPDFDSYENIIVKLDTITDPLLVNPKTYDLAEKYFDLQESNYYIRNELTDLEIREEKIKDQGILEIAYGKFMSPKFIQLGKELQEIKEYINELNSMIEENEGYQSSFLYQLTEIPTNNNEDKNLIGWKVSHKYRAKDEDGTTRIFHNIYILNSDMSEIIYSRAGDKFESIQSVINDMVEKSKSSVLVIPDMEKDPNLYSNNNATTRELKITPINTSTNSLESQAGNSYLPTNLADNSLSTGWAVNLDKDGYNDGYLFGPSINIEPVDYIDYITINNGYGKNESSFKNNTRAAWIQIYRIVPPDSGNPETEDILYEGPLNDTNETQKLIINKNYDFSIPTKTIKLKFSDKKSNGYYYGDKYKDLVISEIKVYGH